MLSKKVVFLLLGAFLCAQLSLNVQAKAVSNESDESNESNESAEGVKKFTEDFVGDAKTLIEYILFGYKEVTEKVINDISDIQDQPEDLKNFIEIANKFIKEVDEYKETGASLSESQKLLQDMSSIGEYLEKAENKKTLTNTLIVLSFEQNGFDKYTEELSVKSKIIITKMTKEFEHFKNLLKEEQRTNFAAIVEWVKSLDTAEE